MGTVNTLTSLPVTKRPTATQAKSTLFSMSLEKLEHSEDLKTRLGIADSHMRGTFTHFQIYEVLSVTSAGNALLLLSAGYDTRSAALEYLTCNGFHNLIEDTADFAAAALDRRIVPTGYILRGDIRRKTGPYVLDALEVATSASLGDSSNIVKGVLDGTISLDLIKRMGIVRLSRIGSRTAVEALTAVTARDTPLTALGFMRALQRRQYGESIASDAIKVGLKYGDKAVTLSGPHTALRMDEYLVNNHPELSTDERFPILEFSSEIIVETMLRGARKMFSEEELVILYESGATAEEVFDGTVTLEQARAIKNGMPASISSGVL
jgi:hypothetical protein